MARAVRIEINRKVMFGKPVIAGTRIPVEIILGKLADGETVEEILVDYPRLKKADIRAVLDFANKIIKKAHPPHAPGSFHEVPH